MKPISVAFGLDGFEPTDGAQMDMPPAAQKVLAAIAGAPPDRPATRIDLELATQMRERSVQDAVKLLQYQDQIEKGPKRGRSDTYIIRCRRPAPEAHDQAGFG